MKNEGEERRALREGCSGLAPLPPPDTFDPVIAAYRRDVDRTLIRENLKLSYRQRLRKLEKTAAAMIQWRGAAQRTSRRGQRRER